jgi:hypothetical protein
MKKLVHARRTVLILCFALAGCAEDALTSGPAATVAESHAAAKGTAIAVSGAAVHFFTQAAIHSQEPTTGGMIQRSTEPIRLTGSLDGYILYQPITVIDFATNTLVNTGTQIFSGTVNGAGPFLLHDSQFRFEVDLTTGATTGTVLLGRSGDAPTRGAWFECHLTIIGTGISPEGDGLADYSGECVPYGNVN